MASSSKVATPSPTTGVAAMPTVTHMTQPPTDSNTVLTSNHNATTTSATPVSSDTTSPRPESYISDDVLNVGCLNDEISTLIIDAILEDDAARHHRSFECPVACKHYPLFRLRPHSDSLAKLCLVSKGMRHLVLGRLYKSMRFHGGGQPVQDQWHLFNSHMTIEESPNVQLSDPKIYIKEITCMKPAQNKEYAANLYKLIQSCPNVRKIDPSPLATHAFFQDKRLPDSIPPTVTELAAVAVQVKTSIGGLVGIQQKLFTDIGRLPREGLRGPYWKRDDYRNVTKLSIEPFFYKWDKPAYVTKRDADGKAVETTSHDGRTFTDVEVKIERNLRENWGNLRRLQDVSIDCREIKLWPQPLKELEAWGADRFHFRWGPRRTDVKRDGIWDEHRAANLYFWAMLGNTPRFPELEKLEIDLELCPWKRPFLTEGINDEWYWLDLWIKRLGVVARSLVVRFHVKSPLDYFENHRFHEGMPHVSMADPLEPNWLLGHLPNEQRMRAFWKDLHRDKELEGMSGLSWKYLDVQLVTTRFPKSEKQQILLRRWSVQVDEHTRELVTPQGGSSLKIYDTQFLEYADQFNTLDYKVRLEKVLHGLPTGLMGII